MDFFPIYQMTKNLFHLMTFINSIFAILEEMASGGSKKLCLVVVVWPKRRKKSPKIGSVLVTAMLLIFWEIGLVSSLKGYFHLAHQLLLRFFLSVACSILKKYYGL